MQIYMANVLGAPRVIRHIDFIDFYLRAFFSAAAASIVAHGAFSCSCHLKRKNIKQHIVYNP